MLDITNLPSAQADGIDRFLMKKTILIYLLICNGILWSQTTLSGIIIDRETKQPLSGVSVALLFENAIYEEVESNNLGAFTFEEIEPGIYDLVISSLEYEDVRMMGIEVLEEEETFLKIRLDIGLSLDKIVHQITRKSLRKADRKLRKFTKSLPKKGWKMLKKQARKKAWTTGKKKSKN